MNNDISKIIACGIILGKMIIGSQRKHGEWVVITFSNIPCENSFKIFFIEASYIRVVSYIYIVVPIGKLIMYGIAKTKKCSSAYHSY